MLSAFYVKSFWLTLTVVVIITLHFTNEKKWSLEKMRDSSQLVNDRALLILELVIPAIYGVASHSVTRFNELCLNRHGIILIYNIYYD